MSETVGKQIIEQESRIRKIGHGAKMVFGVYNDAAKEVLYFPLAKWLGVPNFTTQGLITLLGDNDLKVSAEKILISHNLFDQAKLPQGEPQSFKNCPLANVLGGTVDARTLLSLDFLDSYERLLLVEFFERFDVGRYPELELK